METGECDDFLKVCTSDYKLLRKDLAYPMLAFIYMPLKWGLKKKKQVLYSNCVLSLKEIEKQLKCETVNNRIYLLKIAQILEKTIVEELEHDLLIR